MNLRSYRTFQALILAGLGIFLFSKVMDGRILFYINQRFVIFVLLAALGFIFLAQIALRERTRGQDDHCDDDYEAGTHAHMPGETSQRQGWVLWLVALPLIIGVLSPERPLSASALQTRGINTVSGLAVSAGATSGLEIASTQRSVMDWIRAAGEDPTGKKFEGDAADVTGFVFHDIRLEKNQFMIGRFSIACCVADAVALGMVVNWPDAAHLPENQWVRVRGKARMIILDGKSLPVVDAIEVDIIPQPEQPYLFP